MNKDIKKSIVRIVVTVLALVGLKIAEHKVEFVEIELSLAILFCWVLLVCFTLVLIAEYLKYLEDEKERD